MLTSAQLTEAYGTTEKKLLWNFNYNKKHYQEGKHYFVVEGDELKQILAVVNFTNAKQVRQLYIWTEKGAFFTRKIAEYSQSMRNETEVQND